MTEAAWATRDSRTELGMNTICVRPSPVGVGGAAAGERRSLWMEGGASIGGLGIGESSPVEMAGGGCLSGRLLRVVRVSKFGEDPSAGGGLVQWSCIPGGGILAPTLDYYSHFRVSGGKLRMLLRYP